MKYALVLGGLGAGLIYVGKTWLPGGALLAWLGVSFLLVAAGYAGVGPRVFGKRRDGSIQPLYGLILLPYHLLTTGLWHLQRRLSKESAAHEIVPGLWLGRRPRLRELPAEITLLVDLTVEFPRVDAGGPGCEYLALPCLDATAPDWTPFREAVRRIASHAGTVYVHCALGHGRSATVVAAVLIARGLAANPVEAEARVRAMRAGIGLTAEQRALLQRFCSEGPDVG
jgi:protein-tyrosine phosphatase